MATATYRLERGQGNARVFAEVTVGQAVASPPEVAKLPDRIAEPARAGLAEAAEMLGVDATTLAIVRVRHRYEETTPGVVHSAAFMAVAKLLGSEAHFKPEWSPRDWQVIDRRPWPGPDVPAIWVRRPMYSEWGWTAMLTSNRIMERTGGLFRRESGGTWRIGGYISVRGAYWIFRFPGGRLYRLSCDDPSDVLRENDVLLAVEG